MSAISLSLNIHKHEGDLRPVGLKIAADRPVFFVWNLSFLFLEYIGPVNQVMHCILIQTE